MKATQHYKSAKVGNFLLYILKSLNHDQIISGLVHKNISMDYIRNQFLLDGINYNHLIIAANYRYLQLFEEYQFDSYLCRTEGVGEQTTFAMFDEAEGHFKESYKDFFSDEFIQCIYKNKNSRMGYRSIYYFFNLISNILIEPACFSLPAQLSMSQIADYSSNLFLMTPLKKVKNSNPLKYEKVETPIYLRKKDMALDMYAASCGKSPTLSAEDIGTLNSSVFKTTKMNSNFYYIPATSYISCNNFFKSNPSEFNKQIDFVLGNYKKLTPEQRFALVSILSVIGAVNKDSAELFRRDRSTLVQEHFLKMMCINSHLYPNINSLLQSYLDLKNSYLSDNFRIILAYHGSFEWLPFLLGTNRMRVSDIVNERIERGF